MRFCVYIHDSRGGRYQTNVDADNYEDAAVEATAFFADPFWRGPKPKPGTILRVSPVYSREGEEERTFTVPG